MKRLPKEIWLIALVLVLGSGCASLLLLGRSSQDRPPTASGPAGFELASGCKKHQFGFPYFVNGNVEAAAFPHPGWHAKLPPREQLAHALTHRFVVVTYDPGLAEAGYAPLRAWAKATRDDTDRQGLVVVPGVPKQQSASLMVWSLEEKFSCDTIGEDQLSLLDEFIEYYQGV